MNYDELLEYLFASRNEKYATFSKTLSNGDYDVIGVNNPTLKEIIKQHKDDENLKTQDFVLDKYLEVDYIYFGLCLQRAKNVDEQLSFLENEIYKAKSWAITDSISTYIKKCSFDKFYSFFLNNCNSVYTYSRRMSYILALKFHKDKNVLKVIDYIKPNEEYMVMMAEAWLLATIAIDFKDEIYSYLKDLDDLVLKRKTISKIVDSFRFTSEDKELFKTLRK